MSSDPQRTPSLLVAIAEFPAPWRLRRAEYGYATAEEFLSTCRVENGRALLAKTLGCDIEEIEQWEARLLDLPGIQQDMDPVHYPMGLLTKDESEETNNG